MMPLHLTSRWHLGALLLAVTTACADKSAPSPADEQAKHVAEVVAAGGVVDSILPIPEQLRRFREALPPTDTLLHASQSRDALVARWAAAIAKNDTTDLNAMVMNRREFAWLFYPDSPMSKAPYEAPPQLLWGQLLASSNKGATQLVSRFGGSRVTVSRLRCPTPPDTQGANLQHSKCEARLAAPGKQTVDGILFGTIIERDGRFKFVGLSTDL
jgi:hypothetical protein